LDFAKLTDFVAGPSLGMDSERGEVLLLMVKGTFRLTATAPV
jgi:hypothetical protein